MICKVCGSTDVYTYLVRGRWKCQRPYCHKHYSQYVYAIQRRNRLAKKLRELVG